MARRPIRALAGLAGLMLLIVAWGLWSSRVRPLPSDVVLRKQFHDHRSELDQLAAMAQADTQLVGAGHDWILRRFSVYVRDTPRFNRLLSDEEVRSTGRLELRRLLDRSGLRSISRSTKGDAIRFVVMSHGGARKGIVFSEMPLAPTRASLDGLERVRATYVASGYAALAPRWYLFLESTD